MAQFKIRFGDPWEDGHGKHRAITVETNLNKRAFDEALAKLEAINPNFHPDTWANEYKDDSVPIDVVHELDGYLVRSDDPDIEDYNIVGDLFFERNGKWSIGGPCGFIITLEALMKTLVDKDIVFREIYVRDDFLADGWGYGLFY